MNRRHFLMGTAASVASPNDTIRVAGIGQGYDRYKSFLGKEQQPGPAKVEGGNNWANFIDALRGRDKTKLNGPIEEGALSVTLMHLANISYKVGRSLNIDPATGAVIGDSEAAWLYRWERYRAPFVVPEKV